MKRVVRTTMIAAAVLLSGTVAFAVAASTAPPSVDRISVVVTDRPIREVAAAPAVIVAAPSVVATAAPAPPLAVRPALPRVASSAEVKTPTLRAVVKGIVTRSDKPQVITVPSAAAPENDGAADDDEREVVTPEVRDDTDHDADDVKRDTENSTRRGD